MSAVEMCPFCNLKDRMLRDNEYAQLFLSNPRKTPGHFLVTPKRHIEQPWDMSERELKDIFELVFFTQKRLTESGFSEGCDVRQNYRPFMKQGRVKVDHVHYHIIPRNWQDEIYEKAERYYTEMFIDLPEDERLQMERLVEG